MFLRNLGVSDEMAILDRHILSYMSLTGLIAEGHALAQAQTQARFVMDIYDGAEWTDTDIEDLKAAIPATN